MKLLVEKLPLSENTSFVARTHRTPQFEISWHQHEEYELILFTEGEGLAFVGNYVGSFETGDIFFLGANLPHTFQKSKPEMITSAVVVHFKENFWGDSFLKLPESLAILQLLRRSALGLKVTGCATEHIAALIRSLETENGFRRILTLGESLNLLAVSTNLVSLSSQEINTSQAKDKDRIDSIFNYAMEHFLEPIDLSLIANIAGLTPPAFCNYFKKRTRKTYVTFVNEIRIGYACKLLSTTDNSIAQVCYESGYSSMAHFNRMFLKVKNMTPSFYRKKINESLGA